MAGWKRVMYDKCKKNEITDVQTINMSENYDVDPIDVKARRIQRRQPNCAQGGDCDCETFVYAAYLAPGLHQFVVYCPVTKRAFCKDVIVDLSSADFYPEQPREVGVEIGEKPKPKLTRSNVWRKWREDTEEHLHTAFYNDISVKESFEPELFLKEDDIEEWVIEAISNDILDAKID